jgi:hypothetical protein
VQALQSLASEPIEVACEVEPETECDPLDVPVEVPIPVDVPVAVDDGTPGPLPVPQATTETKPTHAITAARKELRISLISLLLGL